MVVEGPFGICVDWVAIQAKGVDSEERVPSDSFSETILDVTDAIADEDGVGVVDRTAEAS